MTEAKFVKQNDNHSCYGCVAAMIVGETLQDVIDFVGNDGSEFSKESTHPEGKKGFTIPEINKYFAEHEIVLGAIGANVKGFDINFLKDYSDITIIIPLNLPAMILVESPLVVVDHCLYWDGNRIFDPHKGEVDLKEYKILEWWPVVDYRKK